MVRCQGYGPAKILPHMVESVNANHWCPDCTRAFHKGKHGSAKSNAIGDEVNRRILGGKGSANKSAAYIAKILGKSEEWVFKEIARLRVIVREERKTSSGAGDIRKKKPTKEVTELTDDCLEISDRTGGGGTRRLSGLQRAASKFLEKELVNQSVEYAEGLGVTALPMDKDGYPDKLFVLDGILGAIEFKSPTGTPDNKQKMRIKELRALGIDAPAPIRRFETFKAWLDGKIRRKS